MAPARKPAKAAPKSAPDTGEKRLHPVRMRLDLDGESFDDGDSVAVSENQFAELKAAQVFDGEWADGPAVEPEKAEGGQ